MTTLASGHNARRLTRLSQVMAVARVAMFICAIGVFLSAPPSLPWVLAVVALTNVFYLAAQAWMAEARPPLALMLLNGLTVTLVVTYVAVTTAGL